MIDIKRWILVERFTDNKINWYLSGYEIYPDQDSSWVFAPSHVGQFDSRVMIFKNKTKAERIARIVNEQEDGEYGSKSNFKVEPYIHHKKCAEPHNPERKSHG